MTDPDRETLLQLAWGMNASIAHMLDSVNGELARLAQMPEPQDAFVKQLAIIAGMALMPLALLGAEVGYILKILDPDAEVISFGDFIERQMREHGESLDKEE